MPFFVSASSDSIMTYDGFKSNVRSRVESELAPLADSDEEHCARRKKPVFEDSDAESGEVLASKWDCVHNDGCSMPDLWNALKV
jgi:hypothetical protein